MKLLNGLNIFSGASWRVRPLLASCMLLISLALLFQAARVLAPVAAQHDIESRYSELSLRHAVLVATNDDEAKARELLMWSWPTECAPETSAEALRRAASAVLCFRGSVNHAELDRVIDTYLERSGMTRAAVESANAMPADRCIPGSVFERFGPDASACVERINSEAPHPVSTHAAMKGLLGLGVTRGQLRNESLRYLGAPASDGWGYFPGGLELSRWSVGREGLAADAGLRADLSDPIRLGELQQRAVAAVAVAQAQVEGAKSVRESVLDHIAAKLRTTAVAGGTVALYLIALIILLRVRLVASGWRRGLCTSALVLFGLAYLAPDALVGLRLENAPRADVGEDGLFASVFGIFAQVFDVIGSAFTSLMKSSTLERAVLGALFIGLFFSRRGIIVSSCFVGLVLVPHAFETGRPSLLPIDLRAFESATATPSLSLVVGVLSTILGAVLVRGLWIALAERLIPSPIHVVGGAVFQWSESRSSPQDDEVRTTGEQPHG